MVWSAGKPPTDDTLASIPRPPGGGGGGGYENECVTRSTIEQSQTYKILGGEGEVVKVVGKWTGRLTGKGFLCFLSLPKKTRNEMNSARASLKKDELSCMLRSSYLSY